MTAPAKKAGLTQICKADLKHFVVQSALLSLIDPVRGEPTRTSLDENPDGDISGGQQLKQKFLDSFALICSTSSSGAETASALCLEQDARSEAENGLKLPRFYSYTLDTNSSRALDLHGNTAIAEKILPYEFGKVWIQACFGFAGSVVLIRDAAS